MRVLGTEAVQDPTKVEAHVRAQMAKRQKSVTQIISIFILLFMFVEAFPRFCLTLASAFQGPRGGQCSSQAHSRAKKREEGQEVKRRPH